MKKKLMATTDKPDTAPMAIEKHPMVIHPAAEIFPQMTDVELGQLANDIKANGLREAIVTHDGQILDGRNRYLACLRAGVVPRFREWEGGDPVAFVVSANLRRRHLSTSQRGDGGRGDCDTRCWAPDKFPKFGELLCG